MTCEQARIIGMKRVNEIDRTQARLAMLHAYNCPACQEWTKVKILEQVDLVGPVAVGVALIKGQIVGAQLEQENITESN